MSFTHKIQYWSLFVPEKWVNIVKCLSVQTPCHTIRYCNLKIRPQKLQKSCFSDHTKDYKAKYQLTQKWINFKRNVRARNDGRSTDNVRTDLEVDRSTFRRAGHVDRSHLIVLKMKEIKISMLFSCFSCSKSLCIVICRTLIWNPGWMQQEPLFTIWALKTDIGVHALPVTKLKNNNLFSNIHFY